MQETQTKDTRIKSKTRIWYYKAESMNTSAKKVNSYAKNQIAIRNVKWDKNIKMEVQNFIKN